MLKPSEPRPSGPSFGPAECLPLAEALQRYGLNPLDYLALILKGEAPAPILLGGSLVIDRREWNSWIERAFARSLLLTPAASPNSTIRNIAREGLRRDPL